MNETRAILPIHPEQLKSLEIQLGKMVEIFPEEQQMSFPNTFEVNTNDITLRSEGEIEEPQEVEEVEELDANELDELVEDESTSPKPNEMRKGVVEDYSRDDSLGRGA